jgi:aldose 1-epimerase
LREGAELRYQFRSRSDKPTPVNLTQHSYFNLDDGKGTIRDHLLRIPASRILQQEKNLVVTGKYLDIANTPYDFRMLTPVSNGLKVLPEYDTTYVLDSPSNGEPVLAAELRSDQSKCTLELYTTEPVVHFYSGKWIPPVRGKYDTDYQDFSGLCLETHKHPNAVNIPHFPNTIIRPGEEYFQETRYLVKCL